MLPCAHLSPQPKRHLDRFSHFCTAHHRVSLYIRVGRPFPLKVDPFYGDLDPHLIHGFVGPPESSTQMTSRSVDPFLQCSLLWQTDRLSPCSTNAFWCNSQPKICKSVKVLPTCTKRPCNIFMIFFSGHCRFCPVPVVRSSSGSGPRQPTITLVA